MRSARTRVRGLSVPRTRSRQACGQLRFEVKGYYSARRGQYRVIYRINDAEVLVDVIKISHRSDAYG
jgi:mRNA-degrading endonuclease RelE of RelBE toxin-antitoxin system